MSIQQGYFNRVRYMLRHQLLGSEVIVEPEGWNEDEKELVRHADYHGIFPQFSNNLRFVENGYDYLKTAYEVLGINADVQLVKDERHPKTDVWTRVYQGTLDFSTYAEEDKKITIKFNSGGLIEVLKARESENIEIERTTDLDGNLLPELGTKSVNIEGRRIFLQSFLGQPENPSYSIALTNQSLAMHQQVRSLPLKLDVGSHEEAQAVLGASQHWPGNNYTVPDIFFMNNEIQRELNIIIKIKFSSQISMMKLIL